MTHLFETWRSTDGVAAIVTAERTSWAVQVQLAGSWYDYPPEGWTRIEREHP